MFVDKLIDSIIDEFIDKFTKEKIVKKNLYEHTWTSGSSTIVYPITVRKNDITFQWKSDRRIFDKFINDNGGGDRWIEIHYELYDFNEDIIGDLIVLDTEDVTKEDLLKEIKVIVDVYYGD